MSFVYRCLTPAFAALALVLLSAGAIGAPAADAAMEQLEVAEQHSGLAARATTPDEVHQHLQHTINCLVGPDGEAFDAGPGNPCEGLGDGAIDDLRAAEQNDLALEALEQAHQLAVVGLEMDRYVAADAAAHGVAALIKHAQQELMAVVEATPQ